MFYIEFERQAINWIMLIFGLFGQNSKFFQIKLYYPFFGSPAKESVISD
jgi:hypothetical protein